MYKYKIYMVSKILYYTLMRALECGEFLICKQLIILIYKKSIFENNFKNVLKLGVLCFYTGYTWYIFVKLEDNFINNILY